MISCPHPPLHPDGTGKQAPEERPKSSYQLESGRLSTIWGKNYLEVQGGLVSRLSVGIAYKGYMYTY